MSHFCVALLAAFAACSLAQPATDITPNPSLATDGTNPSLATDGTNPSLATDGTNPTPATDRPTVTPPRCDINFATPCFVTYIDRYGFNSGASGRFPDPITFNNAMSNYINSTGLNGLANGRTWWLALQTCLGPDMVPCLFSDVRLQQIFQTNATGMDGTYWLIIFLEQDFVNDNVPYSVIRQNYHCAQQVQVHYASSIEQCRATYVLDVQKDPNNVCLYQVFYMTCLQTIYSQTCGSPLGGFVCNEAGIALRVLVPMCYENPPMGNFCYKLN